MSEVYHIPALLEETIESLRIRPDGTYVDVTFGGGGHSRAVLSRLGKDGRLYAFDRDIEAYENARGTVQDAPLTFVHSDFRYLGQWMDYYGVRAIDGLIADLGFRFHHFDTAERGFSFRFTGPLDMRMNRNGGKTAADLVNGYTEEEIARVLYMYGELKQSRQLAKRIVKSREQSPIETTDELLRTIAGPTATADSLTPPQKKEMTRAYRLHVYECCGKSLSCRNICPAGLDIDEILLNSNAIAVWKRFL